MEGDLSVFDGPTWGADSTSPQPTDARTRAATGQGDAPGNTVLDDRRVQANSIRGSRTETPICDSKKK